MTRPEFTMGYAFERQWLFYKAWGRLLYNPDLPDSFFIDACVARYGEAGEDLFEALKLGSRMPLRLGSIFDFTWDFTLYSEGFLSIYAKSNAKKMISVEELRQHPALSPLYLSVSEYCEKIRNGEPILEERITPIELAESLEVDGQRALELTAPLLERTRPKGLYQEIVDARAWAHLSLYFADKLRSALAYQLYLDGSSDAQADVAVKALEDASEHWAELSLITDEIYIEMPIAQIYGFNSSSEEDHRRFHWKLYLPLVRAEVEALRNAVTKDQPFSFN
jgi:hypothetical protein